MVRIVYGISGLAEAATRGEGALIDALAEYSKQAMEDLIARINVQLLSTTPNATADEYQRVEMDGLGDIIRDSGTYATINRTTATWWRSVVLDNGGTARPLAMPLMQQMMDLLDTPRRDAKTSHILCNRVHFNQYGNLLEDRRRWVNTIELDGGIKALEYVGIPVVPVRQMNPGVMYFIDKRACCPSRRRRSRRRKTRSCSPSSIMRSSSARPPSVKVSSLTSSSSPHPDAPSVPHWGHHVLRRNVCRCMPIVALVAYSSVRVIRWDRPQARYLAPVGGGALIASTCR
jgi:hypothetical protein